MKKSDDKIYIYVFVLGPLYDFRPSSIIIDNGSKTKI